MKKLAKFGNIDLKVPTYTGGIDTSPDGKIYVSGWSIGPDLSKDEKVVIVAKNANNAYNADIFATWGQDVGKNAIYPHDIAIHNDELYILDTNGGWRTTIKVVTISTCDYNSKPCVPTLLTGDITGGEGATALTNPSNMISLEGFLFIAQSYGGVAQLGRIGRLKICSDPPCSGITQINSPLFAQPMAMARTHDGSLLIGNHANTKEGILTNQGAVIQISNPTSSTPSEPSLLLHHLKLNGMTHAAFSSADGLVLAVMDDSGGVIAINATTEQASFREVLTDSSKLNIFGNMGKLTVDCSNVKQQERQDASTQIQYPCTIYVANGDTHTPLSDGIVEAGPVVSSSNSPPVCYCPGPSPAPKPTPKPSPPTPNVAPTPNPTLRPTPAAPTPASRTPSPTPRPNTISVAEGGGAAGAVAMLLAFAHLYRSSKRRAASRGGDDGDYESKGAFRERSSAGNSTDPVILSTGRAPQTTVEEPLLGASAASAASKAASTGHDEPMTTIQVQ
jgi:hypothetical protein